jgi:hypothetical protein
MELVQAEHDLIEAGFLPRVLTDLVMPWLPIEVSDEVYIITTSEAVVALLTVLDQESAEDIGLFLQAGEPEQFSQRCEYVLCEYAAYECGYLGNLVEELFVALLPVFARFEVSPGAALERILEFAKLKITCFGTCT